MRLWGELMRQSGQKHLDLLDKSLTTEEQRKLLYTVMTIAQLEILFLYDMFQDLYTESTIKPETESARHCLNELVERTCAAVDEGRLRLVEFKNLLRSYGHSDESLDKMFAHLKEFFR